MPAENRFETRCLSSLSKVFADSELQDTAFNKASALQNETYTFQVALCSDQRLQTVLIKVDSDLAEHISVRHVGLVPSEFPIYHNHDGDVIRSLPGLFPDPLYPADEQNGMIVPPFQWRSVWVTVKLDPRAQSGLHRITIYFERESGERLGAESLELTVIPANLPKQQLIHTEWFHCDCLANYYKVEVFSEAHWVLIEKYMVTAVQHGINMILTPIFTPPLDTKIGGERPTVQLVDVSRVGDRYAFGFDKLERWVEVAQRAGIEYYEFSHLFTQWGAKAAPKIVGSKDGVVERLFGWETDAAGVEYRSFLEQFIPALLAFIKEKQIAKVSYFHISDEPNMEQLDSYRNASNLVSPLLEGFPIIDALSDYAFYEQGLVRNPIPASDHMAKFLEHDVKGLWTYYCCGQFRKVANRFFSFSSARNRIIGVQLYKYDIKGFLQWGYNFWNTQYSIAPIDPFKVTDAGLAFPSGDAFVVYPGENGPIESLRLEVFYEGLQDLRALQLLESHIGREKVILLLEQGLEQPITFTEYPHGEQWLIAKREEINQWIEKYA